MVPSPFKVWLTACRVKTLPAAVVPVWIGSVLALSVNQFHLLSALAALCGALLIQIGTNFANDYSDYMKGSDREDRLGPTRVTQAGWVKPATMKRATIFVFLLAFLIGVYLVYRGGWPIVIIGVLSILFGVLYTGGSYPLGYNGLGEIFVLIFFGPVAVGGTYYVQTLLINWDIVLIGLTPGLYSSAILTINNIRDIDADKISGKKTIAVRIGRSFSKIEYSSLLIIASLLPSIIMLSDSMNLWRWLPALSLLLSFILIAKLYKCKSGEDFNSLLGLTGLNMIVFALLFTIGWLA